MEKSRMFTRVTKTWNPVRGCRHACYMPKGCFAYQLATGRLKNSPRYKHGFEPRLWPDEFDKTFGRNHMIFVCDMADLFGDWVPAEWIEETLYIAGAVGYKNEFLFLTKNPKRYSGFIGLVPENATLGVTIETNRNIRSMGLTKAPEPIERYDWMKVLPWPKKFVAVEPIMDFDLEILVKMIKDIEPKAVAVGYDNWNCGLPEPELSKTMKLIEELEKFTEVWRKSLRERKEN